MVRKGSPVRVRPRALAKPPHRAAFLFPRTVAVGEQRHAGDVGRRGDAPAQVLGPRRSEWEFLGPEIAEPNVASVEIREELRKPAELAGSASGTMSRSLDGRITPWPSTAKPPMTPAACMARGSGSGFSASVASSGCAQWPRRTVARTPCARPPREGSAARRRGRRVRAAPPPHAGLPRWSTRVYCACRPRVDRRRLRRSARVARPIASSRPPADPTATAG
jgi:hypothetical protein